MKDVKYESLKSKFIEIGYTILCRGFGIGFGSRHIEYAFIITKLSPLQPGKVIDVGCTAPGNYLPTSLTSLGWEVYGIDLRQYKFEHPNFHFVPGDIRSTVFPEDFFDAVYAVSSIEHIGQSEGISDGDVRAMKEIKRIIRQNGTFLVTIPFGKGGITHENMKIYNEYLLHELLESTGWKLLDQIYYARGNKERWIAVPKEVAQRIEPPDWNVALLELKPKK